MKTFHLRFSVGHMAIFAAAMMSIDTSANAQSSGLKADLRSSTAVLATPVPVGVAPTAPAGAVVIGAQAWVCDASMGFAPVVDAEIGVPDSFLAIGSQGNINLPISSTKVPATCGQSALQNTGLAYVTQA